eukprot:COSAG04_NODE_22420_length_355_cov_0.800781_1_plen_89_part_01
MRVTSSLSNFSSTINEWTPCVCKNLDQERKIRDHFLSKKRGCPAAVARGCSMQQPHATALRGSQLFDRWCAGAAVGNQQDAGKAFGFHT